MHARFYAPDANAPGQIVTLSDDEAAHLARVLRLRAGDTVRAFDGRGREFDAIVERASARSAQLRLGTARAAAPERRVAMTLAQAVLKGDKMDDVVRDATMMGAAAIQPLLAARSEVSPAALARGRRRERWQRIAISAAKQCGRAVVPAVGEVLTLPELSEAFDREDRERETIMFVEPAAADGTRLHDLPSAAPAFATVVIGPEGGWTPDEIRTASSSCRLVTLCGPTLRADAMPVAALAALFARWGEL